MYTGFYFVSFTIIMVFTVTGQVAQGDQNINVATSEAVAGVTSLVWHNGSLCLMNCITAGTNGCLEAAVVTLASSDNCVRGGRQWNMLLVCGLISDSLNFIWLAAVY